MQLHTFSIAAHWIRRLIVNDALEGTTISTSLSNPHNTWRRVLDPSEVPDVYENRYSLQDFEGMHRTTDFNITPIYCLGD